MRLAGIAGLVAMLLFLLPASTGADETRLEQQVRTYLESHGRYQQVLAVSDGAALGRLICGKAGRPDGLVSLVCDIPVVDKGTRSDEIFHRYLVSRAPHGAFYFQECPRYVRFASLGEVYRAAHYPCWGDIARG